MDDFQLIDHDYSERRGCYFLDKVVSGITSLAGGFLANRDRRREAETTYGRQREFFGTRYQLQMADMRKAGLNPILSYRQSPPGTGGVAMAPVENMALTGAQTDQSSAMAVKSREEARTQRDVRDQIRAVTAREEATAKNISQDTRVKQVQEMLSGTRLTQEALRNRILEHEAHVARARGTSARATEELYREAPRLRQLDELLRIIFGRGGPTRD